MQASRMADEHHHNSNVALAGRTLGLEMTHAVNRVWKGY